MIIQLLQTHKNKPHIITHNLQVDIDTIDVFLDNNKTPLPLLTSETSWLGGRTLKIRGELEPVYLYISAANRSIGSTTGCAITKKAPTRAFSWLKAPISAFTFKTLC